MVATPMGDTSTVSAGARAHEKGAYGRAPSTQDSAAEGHHTSKHIECKAPKSGEVTATTSVVTSRQGEDIAAARANNVVRAFSHGAPFAGTVVYDSPPRHRQEREQEREEQSVHRVHQQTNWMEPSVALHAANMVESVTDGFPGGNAGATSERKPGARHGMIDSGDIGWGSHGKNEERQGQDVTSERENSFAAVGLLAALCTLLALFLVGALVWVQVREMRYFGRAGKHDARSARGREKESRSTSRDKRSCSREKACSGTLRKRSGHGKGADQHTELRADNQEETLLANKDGRDGTAFAGGFWPAREKSKSITVAKRGSCTHRFLSQQRNAGAGGATRHQWENEGHTVYAEEELHLENERVKALREIAGAQIKDFREEEPHDPGRAHRETQYSEYEYDRSNNDATVFRDGQYGSSGFTQSESGINEKIRLNKRNRSATGKLRSSSTCRNLRQQQWQRSGCNGRHDGGSAAHSTASSALPHHGKWRMSEHDRSSSSSRSNCSSLKSLSVRRATTDACAEDSLPSSFVSSADEEVSDSLSFTGREDPFSPTIVRNTTQPDLIWLPSEKRGLLHQPSASVVCLQQHYEKTCRDLFTRLGEVVAAEGPGMSQTGEEAPGGEDPGAGTGGAGAAEVRKNSSSAGNTCRSFDKPALLSEEAVTEAEQLLGLLEEMFANIKRDFKDNTPGNVTCMIRCCNGLLEKDGLMVLSRCTKIPRLTQKAQKVVEIVVPCIWSS